VHVNKVVGFCRKKLFLPWRGTAAKIAKATKRF